VKEDNKPRPRRQYVQRSYGKREKALFEKLKEAPFG
jgi:hypothetical protein